MVRTVNKQVALVTGASRGIGRGIAEKLAAAGADVAVNCRVSVDQAARVCRRIEAMGRAATVVKGDTRNEQDVKRIISEVEDRLGPITVLVNNAVSAICKPFLDYAVDEWRDQLMYKGLGYYLTIRYALPSMLERGGGVVINILSTVAMRDGSGEVAYAATNGAAAALTRGLAREFGSKGIRINGIMLTWAENAFDDHNPEHTAWLERFALRRVTQIREVADTAAFLASADASGITGALIPVDAGFLC